MGEGGPAGSISIALISLAEAPSSPSFQCRREWCSIETTCGPRKGLSGYDAHGFAQTACMGAHRTWMSPGSSSSSTSPRRGSHTMPHTVEEGVEIRTHSSSSSRVPSPSRAPSGIFQSDAPNLPPVRGRRERVNGFAEDGTNVCCGCHSALFNSVRARQAGRQVALVVGGEEELATIVQRARENSPDLRASRRGSEVPRAVPTRSPRVGQSGPAG